MPPYLIIFATQPTDFGYRSEHVTALATKEISAAFNGSGPRYFYFQGCSNSGRQALNEAQRYPNGNAEQR